MLMLIGWAGLITAAIALAMAGSLRSIPHHPAPLILLAASILCLVFAAGDTEEPLVVQMSVAEMREGALEISYLDLAQDIDRYRGAPLVGQAEAAERVSENSFLVNLTRENGTWTDVAHLVLRGDVKEAPLSEGDVIHFVGVIWGEHTYRVVRRTHNYPYGLYLTVPEIHAYEITPEGDG